MTGLTHIVFANTCALAGATLFDWTLIPAALGILSLGSLLPDLDTPKSTLGRTLWFLAAPLEKAVGHRGLTHSLLGILIYALLSLPLWLLDAAWGYALFAGALSHLAIDTTSKHGIELLWPSRLRAVLPGNKAWRFEVGGRGETFLLVLLASIGLGLIPLSQIGATTLWGRLAGDLGRALTQYRELEGQKALWLTGKLKDRLTEQQLEGRWQAIGTAGTALLILVDDTVRSVGPNEPHNLMPLHVHLEPGQPLRTTAATIPLAGKPVNTLAGAIKQPGPKSQHWLFGQLTLAAPLAVPAPVGRHAVVQVAASGQTLTLDHARLADLAPYGHILVTAGEVLVKQRHSHTAQPAQPLAPAKPVSEAPTVVVPVTLDLRRMSDLQVKAGDQIRVGQPLASNGEIAAQLEAIQQQLRDKQQALLRGVPQDFQRLYQDGVIDRHEFLTYQAAAAKAADAVAGLRSKQAQLQAQQQVTAQLAGTVTNVRIKQQRGDTLTVELLIATAAPQHTAVAANAPERSGALLGPPRGNTRIKDFDDAKDVIARIYTGHETTLYCGCRYRRLSVDWASCGYVPIKPKGRSRRVEWEHVVPAAAFGRSFPEWKQGHSRCGSKKGRDCVQKVNPTYNLMAGDLYNLQPAIGEVNARRLDYSMAMLPGEPRQFGQCDVEIANRKIEPRPSIRGDIARTYQYMDWAYPGRGILSAKNRKLFAAWAAADPVSEWERERARRIERLQGNRNPFVLGSKSADTGERAAQRAAER